MPNGDLNWIAGFIWNIADDVLRDVYVRGKYRDVILPMTVIRRLDAVLEPTKQAVLKLSEQLDDAGIATKKDALCHEAGNAFYNVSPFTLKDLRARGKQQQLKADFEAYLDGFSPNVQEILEKFKFRHQIQTLVDADILGSLIEKFTSNDVNLTAKRLKMFQSELTATDPTAAPVIRKISKPGKVAADPLYGRYAGEIDGKLRVAEYEPDTSLRDTEQVPLLEAGGIEAFFRREVLPHVPDAWIDPAKTQVGFEISFTRHFYIPPIMRSLEEIKADLFELQEEAEGLIEKIVGVQRV